MAQTLSSFFSQMIVVSGSLAGLIFLLRQECLKSSDKIDGDLGDNWYLIHAHIWSNDLKDSVKDLNDFIDQEKQTSSGSQDPISDIFSNSQNMKILKSRLGELKKSYDAYMNFNWLLTKFSEENSKLKTEIERCLGLTVLVSIISLAGVYFYSLTTQSSIIDRVLWGIFDILVLFTLGYYYKGIQQYRNLEGMKSKVNLEKSKYQHVIRGQN